MAEDGVQVDINEVLGVTQKRLQDATNQNILLEAFINQQNREINQLRETIDKTGEANG